MISIELPLNWSSTFEPSDFFNWCGQHGIKDTDWDFRSIFDFDGRPAILFKRDEDALAFRLTFNV